MPFARRVAKAGLPTRYGDFAVYVYESGEGRAREEHAALVAGFAPGAVGDEPVLVRLHSECLTGDVFGSRRCDCGEQLAESMELIRGEGRGALLYLRQEGRGIGLANKVSAYALQERGLDTVEANLALGLPEDQRDYRVAAEMLLDLGVSRACVLTNNPAKLRGLREGGVEVVERLPTRVAPNPANVGYLRTKREKMGHLLPESVSLGDAAVQGTTANGRPPNGSA